MLTNCLAACAHLTITVSEIQRDICEKVVILSYPLAFDASVRGFPSEYRHPLWEGKTSMVSLPDGTFNRFDVIHERVRQTDRRTLDDSKDRACIASRGKTKTKYHVSIIVLSNNSAVWDRTIRCYLCRVSFYPTVFTAFIHLIKPGLTK